jgi:3-dehydroquinate synthase
MRQSVFSKDLGEHLTHFLAKKQYSQHFILMDENTQQFCLPVLQKEVPDLATAVRISVYAGEEHKTLQAAEYVWKRLTEEKADRNAVLINLGGGMMTDLGGFAASAYKRGIDFIHVPTTLLAQVDAAIGGKNGIDFMNYKNQIGVFRQPAAIFVHEDFLKTLPHEQVLSGFAEVVKHALLVGGKLWERIHSMETLQDVQWTEIITESMAVKLAVVEEDPRERHIRKVLNFGHTIGHAIESLLISRGQQTYHGHCIGAGMIGELMLSARCCGLNEEKCGEVILFIQKHFPRLSLDAADLDALIDLMKQDKKNAAGIIRMVLLRKIGRPVIDVETDEMTIREVLKAMTASG